MNTRRQGSVASITVVTLVVLLCGCGNPSGANAEPAGDTNNVATAEAGASTNQPPASTVVDTTPAVRRSERARLPVRPEIAEVIQLVESGAGEEVARTYVAVSSVAYELSLDEIMYLRDIGIPDTVISAMMRRGGELRAQQAETAILQTNLVEAVEQLKEAMATTPSSELQASTPTSPPETATAIQTTQAPADAPEDVHQFYSDLAPYGNWYQSPSYGWVWQPSVVAVNSTWAPYCDAGRWLWSDAGWYWCSDYSWGWAPFHYGRWGTYPGLGWCWTPGSVWGPSWVTWRSSGSCVGWAPLPPACGWSTGIGLTWYGSGISVGFGFGLSSSCYAFVPYDNFCHRNVSHCVVKGSQFNTAYQNSTVINNVINGDNNTIINNGVGYSQVASRVRGEVPKASVLPLPSDATQPLRVDRPERARDGLVVYKPTAVENAGGRPTALRSEVRPASSSATASLTPSAVNRTVGTPSRPAYNSRSSGSAPSAGKAVESRGAPQVSSVGRPTSVSSQSVPSASRPSAVGMGRDTSRSPSASAPPKAAETRNPVTTSRAVGSSSASSPMVGPSRQTTPVPLADPSRNIPARLRTPSPRSPTTVAPNKPVYETRSMPSANIPTATPSRTPSYLPRSDAPRVLPAPNYNRPTTPSTFTPSSRGAVSTAPSMNFQRPPAPSYSAPRINSSPAPQMGGSRPVASAPAMSAPRPSFSTPSAAGPTPSASRSSGPGGGGSRGQRN